MAGVRPMAQGKCVNVRSGMAQLANGQGPLRRVAPVLLVAGALVLVPAAGSSASPLLAGDDVVTTAGMAVTVPVLRNDTTDDSTRPLLTDSVRLGAGFPGSEAVVGSGRRALDLPGVGTYQVLAGGSVRFTPDPDFVGDPEPVRYSVQDVGGARAGEYLRVRVLPAPVVDPRTEPAVQAAIDGVVGARGLRTAPQPPEPALERGIAVDVAGTGDGPEARTGDGDARTGEPVGGELPRTGPPGSVPAVLTGVLLLVVGGLLRRVPVRRPVHR